MAIKTFTRYWVRLNNDNNNDLWMFKATVHSTMLEYHSKSANSSNKAASKIKLFNKLWMFRTCVPFKHVWCSFKYSSSNYSKIHEYPTNQDILNIRRMCRPAQFLYIDQVLGTCIYSKTSEHIHSLNRFKELLNFSQAVQPI